MEMTEFKPYVFFGILVGFIGGLIGGAGAASGGFGAAMIFLYISSGLAAIIILWGFAGVLDQINENAVRIVERVDYFTERFDEEMGYSQEVKSREVKAKQQVEEWKQKGDTAFQAEKYQMAIDCYEYALKLLPDNPEIYSKLSLVYMAVGNIQMAKEYREKEKNAIKAKE